jgi:hypothetical protein
MMRYHAKVMQTQTLSACPGLSYLLTFTLPSRRKTVISLDVSHKEFKLICYSCAIERIR